MKNIIIGIAFACIVGITGCAGICVSNCPNKCETDYKQMAHEYCVTRTQYRTQPYRDCFNYWTYEVEETCQKKSAKLENLGGIR